MDEQELADVEDSDAWDWESAQRLPPIPRAEHRSQFVIEFDMDQVERVEMAAQRAGEGIIAFMRRAILERADTYGRDSLPADREAVPPTASAQSATPRGRNGAETR